MNKLKQVEDRIRDLVPRLKELSFGCEVITRDNRGVVCSAVITWGDDDDVYPLQCTTSNGNNIYVEKDDVIGHPIKKEDIEEAYEKLTGKHLIHNDDNFAEELHDHWQYGKPLSEQSQELISFLYDLLIKN